MAAFSLQRRSKECHRRWRAVTKHLARVPRRGSTKNGKAVRPHDCGTPTKTLACSCISKMTTDTTIRARSLLHGVSSIPPDAEILCRQTARIPIRIPATFPLHVGAWPPELRRRARFLHCSLPSSPPSTPPFGLLRGLDGVGVDGEAAGDLRGGWLGGKHGRVGCVGVAQCV